MGPQTTGGFESRVTRLLRETEVQRREPQRFDVDAFRRQESSIIALNLVAMVGIGVVWAAFGAVVPPPGLLVIGAVAGRVAMQVAELIFLVGRGPLPPLVARLYSYAAVWLHVAFVCAISVLERAEDTHFVVLMLIPIIAAAFRFSVLGLSAVVLVLVGVSFAEVWLTMPADVGANLASEWFEVATVAVAYPVVAVMVRVLVVQLQREQQRLRFSLDALERTRDKLVSKERLAAVGQLASAIAHEIRNPVAMISTSLAMVAAQEQSSPKHSRMFDIIKTEAKRLEAMTTDFLSYARTREPVPKPTSLATTLGYLKGLAEATANRRQVGIVVGCDPAAIAEFDPFQVHQALLNLLSNAVDATAPGEAVEMTAEVDGERVIFHVANPGPPIPDDLRHRIFEPFVTGKQHGTGLGLAIARRIAEAHEGALELTVNERGWVCFSMVLPARAPVAADFPA